MAKKDTGPTVAKLDDDQLRDLSTRHKEKYIALLSAQKKAGSDMRNFGKIIKADLGEFGLDMIKLAIKLDAGKESDETEEKEKVVQTLRVMRWAGIPMGVQGDLFTVFDDRPLDERAFEAGRAAGMGGEPMKAPVEMVGTQGPAFEEWCRGWHIGQDKIFEIRKTNPGKKPAADGSAAVN